MRNASISMRRFSISSSGRRLENLPALLPPTKRSLDY
jgi:hypothetical protein